MKKARIADMTAFVGSDLKASLLKGLRGMAFTMAEILLSLTIIGVVAAITLPSLTGNINERTWNTQRKALYARLSQAVSLMDGVRGYGTLSRGTGSVDTGYGYTQSVNTYSSDSAAEAFITAGLGKVFKLNNVCDYSHLGDCGLPDKFTRYGGSAKISLNDLKDITGLNVRYQNFSDANSHIYCSLSVKAAAFETANGESVLVHYNPLCKGRLQYTDNWTALESKTSMCANFIYDLNGKKGPNTMGKDMGFMSVLFPTDSVVVSPLPYKSNLPKEYKHAQAGAACQSLGDYRLPNIEEGASLTINRALMDDEFIDSSWMWTSTKADGRITGYNAAYVIGHNDMILAGNTDSENLVRCIQRN